MIVGGILLLAFFHAVQLGQGLAATGRASAELAVGGPFAVFGVIAVTVFISSRKRPGETPIGRAMESLSSLIARFRPKAAETTAA